MSEIKEALDMFIEVMENCSGQEVTQKSVRDTTKLVIFQNRVIVQLYQEKKEMIEALKEGYDLSCYAACSKRENTEEFMKELFEIIELFQYNYQRIIKNYTEKK